MPQLLTGADWTPGKTLVTGAAGRIGRAILGELRAQGIPAIGVDRRAASGICTVDIRDSEALARMMDGCRVVIHCAGLHAPHVGHFAPDLFQSVNVDGTREVVRAARRTGIGQLVLTSSTAVYGGGAQPGAPTYWIDENTPPRPRTIYHETKLAAEDIVAEAASAALAVAIVRLGRCFPEALETMVLHRLSRGISEADAARAHLHAARTASDRPEPVNAVARTPFVPDDCADLGRRAAWVIRRKCPDVAACFDRRGWTLPDRIDRIYNSRRAGVLWGWEPQDGPETICGATTTVPT